MLDRLVSAGSDYASTGGREFVAGKRVSLSPSAQVFVHVGAMLRALSRHSPIHWAFHWKGICRAFSSVRRNLERGRQVRRNTNTALMRVSASPTLLQSCIGPTQQVAIFAIEENPRNAKRLLLKITEFDFTCFAVRVRDLKACGRLRANTDARFFTWNETQTRQPDAVALTISGDY